MVWGSEDTLGIISTILGQIWPFLLFGLIYIINIPDANVFLALIGFFGVPVIIIMGIVAVAKGSKIGIGGIVWGSIWILLLIAFAFWASTSDLGKPGSL